MPTLSRRRERTTGPVTQDHHLGDIKAVAAYLNLPPTYLYDAHRAAKTREQIAKATPGAPANRNFCRGGKTSATWVLEWIDRNPDWRRRA